MAWDDTKITGNTLSSSEWNSMVTDQKTRPTASETATLVNKTIDGNNNTVSNVTELSDDTTPVLGGNLDVNDKNISGIGSVGFTQEFGNGSKSASFNIDFSDDQKQNVTLTAASMTATLVTTGVKVGNYVLKMINGGLATLAWTSESGSILFPGGTAPTLTSSGTDVVSLYFDGTNWYGQAGVDFQ